MVESNARDAVNIDDKLTHDVIDSSVKVKPSNVLIYPRNIVLGRVKQVKLSKKICIRSFHESKHQVQECDVAYILDEWPNLLYYIQSLVWIDISSVNEIGSYYGCTPT